MSEMCEPYSWAVSGERIQLTPVSYYALHSWNLLTYFTCKWYTPHIIALLPSQWVNKCRCGDRKYHHYYDLPNKRKWVTKDGYQHHFQNQNVCGECHFNWINFLPPKWQKQLFQRTNWNEIVPPISIWKARIHRIDDSAKLWHHVKLIWNIYDECKVQMRHNGDILIVSIFCSFSLYPNDNDGIPIE